MAIINTALTDIQGPIRDKDGVLTLTEVWKVRTDNPLDNGFTISVDPSLPQLFGTHPNDGTLVVISTDPQRVKGQMRHWEYTVQYSNQFEATENPLDEPPEIVCEGDLFEEPMYFDLSDPPRAVVNSANDPFDPAETRDASRPYIEITQNVSVYDFNVQQLYTNAINSDPFAIQFTGLTGNFFGVGVAKIRTFRGESGIKNDIAFWKRKIRIDFNPNGWDAYPLDRGFNYIAEEPKDSAQIIGVGTNYIEIGGDYTAEFLPGQLVVIQQALGNPNNNGPHIIAGAPSIVFTGGKTRLTFVNNLANSSSASGVALFGFTKTKKRKILTQDGSERSDPALLDGFGFPMDAVYQPFQPGPEDAVFLHYVRYYSLPYSFLNLPMFVT